MAIVNKLTNKQVLVRVGRKGNPMALLVGTRTSATTVKSSMEIPQKLKMDLDPAIPLLGTYLKELKTPI